MKKYSSKQAKKGKTAYRTPSRFLMPARPKNYQMQGKKKIKQELPFYVICDNIRSLENIGSIFRTADALDVNKIFLCGICGKPPHQKISKSALGAENWIEWEYYSVCWRIVERLKKEKVFVAVLEQTKNSLSYSKFEPKFPLALVIGNEIKGVSPSVLKRADKIISLPMFGRKKSLNVAVAFGIAGYEMNKTRHKS